MTLLVNGKPMAAADGTTVAGLLAALSMGEKKVAVEVNRELVIRKDWAAHILNDGDRVEVVTFVGGG